MEEALVADDQSIGAAENTLRNAHGKFTVLKHELESRIKRSSSSTVDGDARSDGGQQREEG